MTKNKIENLPSSLPGFHLASVYHKTLHPIAFYNLKGHYNLYTNIEKEPLRESNFSIDHFNSTDVQHWKHFEEAISMPFQNKEAYIVVDTKNTSGLGGSKTPLIMFLTTESPSTQIHVMYSTDGGLHWTSFNKNAILDLKKSVGGCPYVFWHEGINRWIMMLTQPNDFKVLFYTSKNLLKWDFVNDFGGHPSFKQKWRYASLVPAQVLNVPGKSKWILMVSAEGDYSVSRYFVGEFDGKSFLCDHALDQLLLVDHGKDYFAPIPCQGLYPKRNVMVATMSNTAYIDHLPTKLWKNQLSSFREFNLNKEADGSFKLIQKFIPELQSIRDKHFGFPKSAITTELEWPLELASFMEFDIRIDSAKGCSLEFDFGNKTKIYITWDVLKHQLTLDRTARPLGFHSTFNSLDVASVSSGHILQLHVMLDRYSIEVIADNGKTAISSLFYAPNDLHRFRIIGKQFAASGDIWTLKNLEG